MKTKGFSWPLCIHYDSYHLVLHITNVPLRCGALDVVAVSALNSPKCPVLPAKYREERPLLDTMLYRCSVIHVAGESDEFSSGELSSIYMI